MGLNPLGFSKPQDPGSNYVNLQEEAGKKQQAVTDITGAVKSGASLGNTVSDIKNITKDSFDGYSNPFWTLMGMLSGDQNALLRFVKDTFGKGKEDVPPPGLSVYVKDDEIKGTK